MCERTHDTDVLVIADEIQTGLGRTGRFLKSSTWPRRPDVVLLAKALGGGLIPLSACLTDMTLFQRAYGSQYVAAESHHSTFSNNAIGCVAGLATLKVVTDALITDVGVKGARFRDNLERTIGEHPLVVDIRGDGLMTGIQLGDLDHPWLSFEQFGYKEFKDRISTGILLCSALYSRGFYGFVCGHDWSVLRVQPRLDISDALLDRLVSALAEKLERLHQLT